MKFGDRLKELRARQGWTQPQAAEAIGVEQSYLSKLENGHSTPSGDVLSRILSAYDVDVGGLLSGLDHSAKAQLRQIAEVDDYLSTQITAEVRRGQRRAAALAVCLALGAALIYAGSVSLFFPETEYRYRSQGVVKTGEPLDFFESTPRYLRTHEEQEEYHIQVRERLDEVDLWTSEERGSTYTIAVPGGTRSYYRSGSRNVNRFRNRIVTFLGVFAATLGFVGLLIQASSKRPRA